MFKKLFNIALFLCCSSLCLGQDFVQIGDDLSGVLDDEGFGAAIELSASGDRVVVGSFGGSTSLPESVVRVFEWNGSAWIQIGSDLAGDDPDDFFGRAVSISDDGSVIAVGAYENNAAGNGFGQVKVFEETAGEWNQIGADIFGTDANGEFGRAVALNSDGSRLAVGAPQAIIANERRGRVSIYDFTGSDWVMTSAPIDGQVMRDGTGNALEFNQNADRIVIGASVSGSTSTLRGKVLVYEDSGSGWTLLGSPITESVEQLGTDVGINAAGDRIVMGGPNNDTQASNAGSVLVKEFDGNDWVTLGERLFGTTDSEFFGSSVGMNDSGDRIIAGGFLYEDPSSNLEVGAGIVYELVAGDWEQVGEPLTGDNEFDLAGRDVAMNATGNWVAVGIPSGQSSNVAVGLVRVYQEGGLGVDAETFAGNSFRIAPNPATDQLQISNPNSMEIKELQIYDYLGRLLLTSKLIAARQSSSISIASLPAGWYSLVIQTPSGNQVLPFIRQD